MLVYNMFVPALARCRVPPCSMLTALDHREGTFVDRTETSMVHMGNTMDHAGTTMGHMETTMEHVRTSTDHMESMESADVPR